MKNPWLKKNPLMSMWLSGAHKAAGAARGQVSAAVKRETNRASKEATTAVANQVLEFWSPMLGRSAKPKAKKRK